MTLSMHPLWVQSGQYSASDERIGITNTLFEAPGRARKTDLVVSPTSTASMKVEVGSGVAIIAPPRTAFTTGYYIVTNTEKYTVTVPASNASNARIDIIVIKAHDSELIADDTDNVSIEVIQGTPGAVPVAPNVPAMCLELARIRVEANSSVISSSVIDNSASPVAALVRDIGGGFYPVSSNTEISTLLDNVKKNSVVSSTNPVVMFDTRTGQITFSTDGRTTTSSAGSSFLFGSTRKGTYDPTKGYTPIIQSGTVVVKTSASGDAIWSFPSPFPNGLSTCVASLGDKESDGRLFSANNTYWSLSQCCYQVYDKNGSKFANMLIRIEYVAVGW